MSNTRYLEPVIQFLFDIVKQDAPQDEEESKQMAEEAKEYIAAIQELDKSDELARKTIYQKLNKKITLNETVSLETKDEKGETFLIKASKNDHTLIVQSLLQANADPNEGDYTPLNWAAFRGHVSIVQALLTAKADPNKADKVDTTSISWAARNGNTLIVETLLTAKADPSQNESLCLRYLIEGLIEGRGDIQIAQGDIQIAQMLLQAKADPSHSGRNGVTSLMSAVFYGYIDLVEVLLDAGAATDLLDTKGKTALDYAVAKKRLNVVSSLLKHQAFINNPTKLYGFLMLCDPRDPDLLFCLNALNQQQNNLRALNLPDAKLLTDKQYQTLEKYRNELSKVGEKLGRDALKASVGSILIPPLINIISEYDAPLYHLNNSSTLFNDQKQINQFREELTKKYNESFPSRKKFFGWF